MTKTTSKNEILAKTIRGGAVVLAKDTKFGLSAVQYTNKTQALKKAEELRRSFLAVEVIQPSCGPCFYIRMMD